MGYAAHHVEHIGLKGSPDWLLWKRALQDNLIFVSNNAHDFRKLSSKSAIHPGVVLILPMARPETQRQLFRVGLDYLSGRTDIINRLIEVDLCEDRVEIREIEMP
jgi:predicted nuclease of predicted toxin-antitoxin system